MLVGDVGVEHFDAEKVEFLSLFDVRIDTLLPRAVLATKSACVWELECEDDAGGTEVEAANDDDEDRKRKTPGMFEGCRR